MLKRGFQEYPMESALRGWHSNKNHLNEVPDAYLYSSPFSASAVLLPLSPINNYTPEILICGGSTMSDTVDPLTLSSQTPASKQCIRMVLNTTGIAAGWQVESMPQARVMLDAILLPDGRVLVVNGAQTGVGGNGNVGSSCSKFQELLSPDSSTQVGDLIGQSNADNPAFQAVIYNPTAPVGYRFSQNDLPTSNIARMYHSVASLTPNGTIMLAGSNPNTQVSTIKFATEYRVEWLTPSYLNGPRPSYTALPSTIGFGTTFTLQVTLPSSATSVIGAHIIDRQPVF
jgi:hypothetical protein